MGWLLLSGATECGRGRTGRPAERAMDAPPGTASALHVTEDSLHHLLDSPSLRTHRKYSGLHKPAREVVRDSGAWIGMWRRVAHYPSSPPAVDFSRHILLVAALGARHSTGYAIRIDSVAVVGGHLVAWVCTGAPGPGMGGFATMTAPLDIVRVPRTSHRVRFVERGQTAECTAPT